jgi:hypothetical protein
MKLRTVIVFAIAIIIASACMPSARGQQLTWNPNVGNTAGGCPIVEVITQPSLIIGQQCAMSNNMAGIDPSTPLVGADGLPTDPSTILTWRTTFRFFNRDIKVHSGTQQTFSPDGSTLFPVMWTWPTGASSVVPVEITGAGIAPLGTARQVLTGATSTTVAKPFAVTSLALMCPDGRPCLVGETFVEQVDAAGNTKVAYSAADRATYSSAPGTSFAVQLDVGYWTSDTTLIFLNPTYDIANVTVLFYTGYSDASDFATREKEVFATTTVFVQPSFGWFGWPFFMGFGALGVNGFCHADAACQNFLNTGQTWQTGLGPGTESLAVISSNVPVMVGVVRSVLNPDGSTVQVGAPAFPLIPPQPQQ